MALTEKHIKNIFVYAVPRFVGYGINLLTLPILTRILTPADFGIITLAWLFPTLAAGIMTLCLGSATQRYYFEYKYDKNKLYALIFSTQVFLYIVFVVSAVGIYLFKGSIAQSVIKNANYGNAVFIAFLAAYLGQIINFYLLMYQSMEKAGTYSLFTALQTIITASASLLLVWGLRAGYLGMLYGSLIGESVVCASILIHFNRMFKAEFNLKILWENMKFGLQIVPKSLTGFINRFFDKYMLNNMFSLSVVGVYNIGQNIGNTIFILMNTVWSSFQPVCYSEVFDKGKEGSKAVGRLFTIFSFLTLLPLVAVIIFAQEIVYILAPASYYPAIDIIIIIAGAIATNVFGMYVGVQYAYSKKAYWIFPVSVAGAFVNIIANILLIPRLGLVGAGLSVVATYTFVNVILTVIGQRLYRITYEWKTVWMLFVHLAASIGIILYGRAQGWHGVSLYAVKFLLLGLFILIGINAGIINKRNFQKLLKMIRSPHDAHSSPTQVQPV